MTDLTHHPATQFQLLAQSALPDSTDANARGKLETFPYTQYGTVAATVDVVSADAVTDERKGADGKAAQSAVYPATLTLHQMDMLVDGKRVNLSPGMNITVEIKTGQRRIIEYLLSPVQRAGRDSLRER